MLGYDARGNRTSDDNTSTLTHDRRDYTYDQRGNVINVHGKYFTGGVWHDYDVASAFDAKNRRVFKSFLDNATGVQEQWFFYYDPLDRLIEIRYTPNTASASDYSVFQLFWLGDRLVLYWQTDYPTATTTRRYIGTDETRRPLDMWTWPASGNGSRVWAVNPSAWGVDTIVVGPSVYQPILFAGQYTDSETAALHNGGEPMHRPGLALNGFRTYDSFTGGYLQVDPSLHSTWSTYTYASANPVGMRDRDGRESEGAGDGEWVCETSSIESNGKETITVDCRWEADEIDPVIGDWGDYLPPVSDPVPPIPTPPGVGNLRPQRPKECCEDTCNAEGLEIGRQCRELWLDQYEDADTLCFKSKIYDTNIWGRDAYIPPRWKKACRIRLSPGDDLLIRELCSRQAFNEAARCLETCTDRCY